MWKITKSNQKTTRFLLWRMVQNFNFVTKLTDKEPLFSQFYKLSFKPLDSTAALRRSEVFWFPIAQTGYGFQSLKTMLWFPIAQSSVLVSNRAKRCSGFQSRKAMFWFPIEQSGVPVSNRAKRCSGFQLGKAVFWFPVAKNGVQVSNRAEQCSGFQSRTAVFWIPILQSDVLVSNRAKRWACFQSCKAVFCFPIAQSTALNLSSQFDSLNNVFGYQDFSTGQFLSYNSVMVLFWWCCGSTP